jgi:predicted dehydrogenase
MTKSKDNNRDQKNMEESKKTALVKRRTLIKAIAGLPVMGLLGYEVSQKRAFDDNKKASLIKEIGLENIEAPGIIKSSSKDRNDLIRVGIIGFGRRAKQLSESLGFMHPVNIDNRRKANKLNNWLEQEYLNVAIVGICDVFDLHADNGMATARNELRPGGDNKVILPVKQYRCYQEMLDDKDIDAVIIATPDHHHATIAIAAAKAGKHVYCEKSPAHSEEEISELYNVIKNSKITYQLGHQIPQNIIFQQAKEIIKRGILGKITLVETTTNRNNASGAWIRDVDENGKPLPCDERNIDWNQWLGSRPKVPFSADRFYNWTKWFDYDLGMIGQLFTHEFDAVNQLLRVGIPKSANSSGGIYFWKDNREIPDSLHCVFEYPERDLTLLYSANLACSRNRGRVFMGNDASMELGESIRITADGESKRFSRQLNEGIINSSEPMITMNPASGKVDAITSATEKYYSARGLTTTMVNGKPVDVTHLHIKEWLDCIRSGATPTANIDRAFEEGITCLMAHKSYMEKRQVFWDKENKVII